MSDERERRLDQVIADYIKAVEAGERPDRAALLAKHPDLADDLHSYFCNRDEMDRHSGLFPTGAPDRSLPCAFGSYEILQELGRGGMGIVFKARDTKVGRTVALKMIHGGRLASREDKERFRIEVEATASLDHPLVVPIYEVGESGGQPYFTTKFMEGGSLDTRLDAYRTDPRAAARLVASAARTIHHAHQRGLMHRDLKPANLLIDAEGRPHVTDFGLALRTDAEKRLTTDGTVVGTASYMAPEQARGDRKLTTAVDVYALGAILYEILTGRAPFSGDSPVATLQLVLDKEPTAPSALDPGVNRDLEKVCLKCLEKDPNRRYGSAEALAEDLERWLEGRPVVARPVGAAGRAWRSVRRHPAVSLLALMAMALLLALGWAYLEKSAREQQALAEQSGRRQQALAINVYLAKNLADRIRLRFEKWGGDVLAVAERPELRALLEETPQDRPRLQAFCKGLPLTDEFQNWHLLDRDGIMVGRVDRFGDDQSGIVGRSFAHRDYFSGTKKHLEQRGLASVHVSNVYQSIADTFDKYDIGVPVRSAQGGFLGVVAVAVTTHPDMRLPLMLDDRWKNSLAGPGDDGMLPAEKKPRCHDGRLILVVHPAYGNRDPAEGLSHEALEALSRRDCTHELTPPPPSGGATDRLYEDPFGHHLGAFKGGWLAGFAPVGHTGFVVIVQSRDE